MNQRTTKLNTIKLTKHSVISSGPNPHTLTCKVFVHNLFDGKLNAKLSPNLGFDRSDIGFVQPLREVFELLGNSTILMYLNKNTIVRKRNKILVIILI